MDRTNRFSKIMIDSASGKRVDRNGRNEIDPFRKLRHIHRSSSDVPYTFSIHPYSAENLSDNFLLGYMHFRPLLVELICRTRIVEFKNIRHCRYVQRELIA